MSDRRTAEQTREVLGPNDFINEPRNTRQKEACEEYVLHSRALGSSPCLGCVRHVLVIASTEDTVTQTLRASTEFCTDREECVRLCRGEAGARFL